MSITCKTCWDTAGTCSCNAPSLAENTPPDRADLGALHDSQARANRRIKAYEAKLNAEIAKAEGK